MRLHVLAVLALVAAGCARPVPPAAAPAAATDAGDARLLTVVATTDVHGHVETLPWLSGHLATLRALRRADGGGVLLVDAGDMWQGTLESNLGEGAAVVRAYNALGYDAATIGNHEFDFGPAGPATVPRRAGDNPTGNVEVRARQARFPLLAANLRLRDGRPWTPRNIQPSVIKTVAGIRVGLIGVTTFGTPFATDPRNLVQLEVTPLADAVQQEARALRRGGATVVVVLAHAGGACTRFDDPDDLSSCRTQGEVFRLASALPPGLVDVIASGHSHDAIAHRVNGIAIAQAYQQGRAFSRIDLTVGRDGRVSASHIHAPRFLCDGVGPREVTSWAADACAPTAYEGRPVRRDARIVDVLKADIAAADRKREQPLGASVATRYRHVSSDESAASVLVVDLLREARPGTDVAIYNATGTRAELPEGPITYGDIYALLPFDSVIATGTLTAGELAQALTRAVSRGPFPIVSGIEAEVTCGPAGPVVTLLRQARPLAPETPLAIVTSEFLSSGGAGYFPDMDARFTLQLDMPMRDAVASAVSRSADGIESGRIGRHDPLRRRVRLPGNTFPVRCPVSSSQP